MSLGPADADAFERCIAGGGVAVFPADTVYGLACDPSSSAAIARLYELKGRAPDKPAAVMFFALDRAFAALPEIGPRVRAVLERLLPGPLTVLVANPCGRFALATPRPAQEGPERDRDAARLGLRVPSATGLERVGVAVLQSSANHAGAADARTLAEIPAEIRAGADLVLDGGALPGTPSTVVDLSRYEQDGRWEVLREGALAMRAVAEALDEVGRG